MIARELIYRPGAGPREEYFFCIFDFCYNRSAHHLTIIQVKMVTLIPFLLVLKILFRRNYEPKFKQNALGVKNLLSQEAHGANGATLVYIALDE